MDIKKRIKELFNNKIFISGVILLIFMNLGNFLSYLYQFIMARMLGPADYGVLAVLISIAAIFGIPTVSIQTFVARQTAKLNLKKDYPGIKGMMDILLKKSFIIALWTFVIFALISLFLSPLLHISYWLLVFTGLFVFSSFLFPVNAGIMQGMKKFKSLGFSFFINCFVKLFFGIILVYSGLKVFGATAAFIIGSLVAFLITFPFLKQIVAAKAHKGKTIIMTSEANYTILAMLIFVFLYSLDVIFAKAFFSPDIAGKYAVISMIGKIILFVNMAIGSVMFPINSEKFFRGQKNKNLVIKTLLLVLSISLISLLVLWIFPEQIIKILFGSVYSNFSDIMIYAGISFSLLSLLNIFILHKISVDEFKTKSLIALFLFLVVQITLFMVFHSNIKEFSIAFMFANLISFIGGILVFKKWKK